jgi:hypothetical protein
MTDRDTRAKWLIALKLPELERMNDRISAAKGAASDSMEAYLLDNHFGLPSKPSQNVPELLRYLKGDAVGNDFDWLNKKDLPERATFLVRSLAKYNEDIQIFEDNFHAERNNEDVNAFTQKRRTREVQAIWERIQSLKSKCSGSVRQGTVEHFVKSHDVFDKKKLQGVANAFEEAERKKWDDYTLGQCESLTAQLIEKYEGVVQKFNFEKEQAEQAKEADNEEWQVLHEKFKQLDGLVDEEEARQAGNYARGSEDYYAYKTRKIYSVKNLQKLKTIVSKALTALTDEKVREELPSMAEQAQAELARLNKKEATARTAHQEEQAAMAELTAETQRKKEEAQRQKDALEARYEAYPPWQKRLADYLRRQKKWVTDGLEWVYAVVDVMPTTAQEFEAVLPDGRKSLMEHATAVLRVLHPPQPVVTLVCDNEGNLTDDSKQQQKRLKLWYKEQKARAESPAAAPDEVVILYRNIYPFIRQYTASEYEYNSTNVGASLNEMNTPEQNLALHKQLVEKFCRPPEGPRVRVQGTIPSGIDFAETPGTLRADILIH